MKVQRIQNNNNNSMNFYGRIPKTKQICKYIDEAISMAASGKNEEDKTLSKQFFNTLSAMKNDGTNNVLSIRYKHPKIAKNVGDNQYNDDYIVQYGSQKETVNNGSVINTVIKFGEKLFGKNVKNLNFKGLDIVTKAQELADTVYKCNETAINLLNAESHFVQQKADAEYKKAFEQLLEKRRK